MPISLEFHSPDAELAQRFSRVLRDDPDYAAELGQALDAGRPVAAAHFNGAPVAVALLDGDTLAWMVVHPATR
ncbi:MAG: GNAT family N-acetyltransferase, partial [Alloalcanivorax venustensis]